MSGLVVPLKTEIIKVHQGKKKDLLTGVWMDEWFVFKYYYNFFFWYARSCCMHPETWWFGLQIFKSN